MLESLPIIYIFWHYLLSTWKREYFRNVTESLLLSSLVSTARFFHGALWKENRDVRGARNAARARFLALFWNFFALYWLLRFPPASHFFSAWDRSNILLVPASDTNMTREEKPLSCGFRDTFDTRFSRENILCDTMWQLSKIIRLWTHKHT